MIDVGGPSMLRGAAKNFAHVAPVCRPERYGFVLDELRSTARSPSRPAASSPRRRSRPPPPTRPRSRPGSPSASRSRRRSSLPLEKVLDLSYGENPHQRAAYYAERGARTHLLSRVEQLHGKALSFNNLNDLSAARMLAREFALPACVIVKHANPCGVAIARDDRGGVRQARSPPTRSRPSAASSSLNRAGRRRARREARGAVRRGAARARATTDDALAALRAKPDTRILVDRERRARRRRASATTSACSAACSSRIATPTSRTARAGGRLRRARRGGSGATSSSPGVCASTCRRTRSCSRRTCRRSASAPAR